MDDLFGSPLGFVGSLLWMAATSKQAVADERDRLLATLAQLRPALELAASGASERFDASSTARYVNAVSDLHCLARVTGAAHLDALAHSLGQATAKLSKESLTADEAGALLNALSTTVAKLAVAPPG